MPSQMDVRSLVRFKVLVAFAIAWIRKAVDTHLIVSFRVLFHHLFGERFTNDLVNGDTVLHQLFFSGTRLSYRWLCYVSLGDPSLISMAVLLLRPGCTMGRWPGSGISLGDPQSQLVADDSCSEWHHILTARVTSTE